MNGTGKRHARLRSRPKFLTVFKAAPQTQTHRPTSRVSQFDSYEHITIRSNVPFIYVNDCFPLHRGYFRFLT